MRVFLSYARRDAPEVAALADYVRRTPHVVLLDPQGSLEPEASLLDEVRRAMRAADAVLVWMSPAGATSDWVRHELGMAWGARLPVVAVVSRPGMEGLLPDPRSARVVVAGEGAPEAVVQALLSLSRRGDAPSMVAEAG